MGLRCFVAMAVSRDDTDQIYDKHILPTLRAMGITAVFIGRLEHNDDIDKRIMREIEECDFVIADLTDVRPSVYFEADFAERKVPVVYTWRADHLGQGTGDLRVHFDLLMRNIVPWSNPKDRRFASKLAKRIRVAIRPLIRQRRTDAQAKAEVDQFHARPLLERVRFVAETFRDVLTSSGYRSISDDNNYNIPWFGRLPKRGVLEICGVYSADQFSKINIQTSVSNLLELVKSRFHRSEYDRYRYPGTKAPHWAETKDVKRTVARLVFCSLRKIPNQRLEVALQYHKASRNGQVYYWPFTTFVDHKTNFPCDVLV